MRQMDECVSHVGRTDDRRTTIEMRRVKIAHVTSRHSTECDLVQGSFVWPNDMTWKEFVNKHQDEIPPSRLLWAKRR